MVKLSVIIVNYNVKYFLEQCLISVLRASKEQEIEVFVVDNNSVDGSPEMVKERFPQVRLIENKENTGFSKANNQAIKKSRGEYVLLLNPDTLVEKDTFEKCIHFMDEHPDAGGLGVKMVDGKGRFLPESKRGLPTPQVAFYKIFGLSSLFPKSEKFARYHLGHLSPDETHEVDVLAGAFMFMRKKTLDKTGLLDEDFFMYGEDIDLSRRIQLQDYKNYYFPHTRIIHYKGESTKKGSLNYVFVFYKAMIIFARKHFSAKQAGVFSLFINIAIYLRAFISLIKRFTVRSAEPFVDLLASSAVLYGLTVAYESFKGSTYPGEVLKILIPVYAAVIIAGGYFSGMYDKPVKLKNIARGTIAGALVMLIVYALLPEEYRFSRAVILSGGAGIFLVFILLRLLYHHAGLQGFDLNRSEQKRIAAVGGAEEIKRVKKMLESIRVRYPVFVEVRPGEQFNEQADHFVGRLSDLPEIVRGMNINEVIFCSKDIDPDVIITQMSRLEPYNTEFKIAPPESAFIIGSNSVNSSGEFYSLFELNSISTPANKRNKRLFDIAFSLVLLITAPFTAPFMSSVRSLLPGVFSVLTGKKTWIGYDDKIARKIILPKIKKGIISIGSIDVLQNNHPENNKKAHINYANNYNFLADLKIIRQFLFSQKSA